MMGVLYRILVVRYYKLNAGFFLLVLILLFGIMSGQETVMLHHAIMTGMIHNPMLLVAGMVVWLAYGIKCTWYVVGELAKPDNSFLFNLHGLPAWRCYAVLLRCHGCLYAPALLYGCATAAIGLRQGQATLPAALIVFLVVASALPPLLYGRSIATWRQPLLRLPEVSIFPRKRYLFFLLHYSLHDRKGSFAAIKLFSLLLLQAMIAANSGRQSKEAICELIMFLISAHALLPLYYVRFTEGQLSFMRGLPISAWRRYMVYVITYSIIFLPELLFLLCNVRTVMPLSITLSLYALAIAQLSLYTAMQHTRWLTTDRYTMFVCGLFFICLLVLASSGIWELAAAEMLIATVLFLLQHGRFELRSSVAEQV